MFTLNSNPLCKSLLLLLLCTVVSEAFAQLQPDRLTCEYKENPLGIDTRKPRFSWTFLSSDRNQLQSAFEILVSDSQEDIQKLNGNMWTTGKTMSSENTLIEYTGTPLRSFSRYYWRLKVYDNEGKPSSWSEPNWFETAMLDQDDWEGQWISDRRKQFDHDEEFYQDDPMPLFRKNFELKKEITRARLYISGLGYYEAYINGKKVSDHMLDPGWTSYKKEVLYVVHDITSMVRKGNNVTGIMLGNGWWNPLPIRLFGRFNLRDVQQTGRPCLRAEIHILYNDGSSDKIVTDGSWITSPGPIIRNNTYLGEHYDARLADSRWNSAVIPHNGWKSAEEVAGPSGSLTVQMQPPVRVTRVMKPVRITEPEPGVFIADMGQNFAGVARIRVTGKAGTIIRMRYGEALHEDGSLNFLTTVAGQIKEIWHLSGGPGAPPTAWQEDDYILNGRGKEVWSPRFTFHGFRYIEVHGWPGKLIANDIEGLRMNSDLEEVGEFSCSNPMFNKLQEAIKWTFLSNVFSVQSDCPGREKMGYGADIVVTADAFLYNFDMANFYTKSVHDFANDQQPDGGITEIAPYTGIADKGYGGESGPLGWQLGFMFLQKQLYDFYSDKRIIGQHYDAVVRQLGFLENHAIDGLYHWDISDHEALDPKPEAFTAAAFYYHHALIAAQFAGILGKKEDSTRYAGLADHIKHAIVRKYLVPTTGRFDNATQSAQLFALWYDLSPEEELTFDVLMNEFRRHNWHVSSGIFGNKMMYDVLRRKNKNDIAYRIVNQQDFPSLGYMLKRGATTLWESWQYPDNSPSQNHPMFGSVSEWFYRSLLGINPTAPGFATFMIKPEPAGDLTWAKGSYHSIRGAIVSDWKIENGAFTLRTKIPPNTKAEVWIPAEGSKDIKEGTNSILPLRWEDGYAVIEVGSGEYTFSSSYKGFPRN
jgi:alpha-L-rhamnosidase